jgi:hypothetical protein
VTQSVKDVLVKARELIATPDRWIKENIARDKPESREWIYPNHPAATCWCSVGAICAAEGLEGMWSDTRSIKALKKVLGTDDVSEWNDAPERTHDEVLAAFDKAIALAEASDVQ